MATQKVSEMAAAVSVADADLVPVVQGGINKKATVDLILDALTGARVATAIGSTAANLVYAGPATGAAAVPAARSLVAADIPSLSAVYLPIGGGTLTGALVLSGAPTIDLHAATKVYVDGLIAGRQPLDATLTALAALGAGPGFLQVTGADTFAIAALTDTQINTALGYTAANAASLNPANLSAAVPTTKGGTGLTAIGTALQVLRVNAGATALEFADAAGGITGVVSDAATNTVSDALVIQHATSGTAAAGFGTGLLWQGENAAGTMRDMASIDAVFTDSGDASEDTRIDFNAMLGGTSTNLAAMSFTNGSDFSVYATNAGASNYRRLLFATNIIAGGSAGVLLQGVGSGQNDGNLYLGTLTGNGSVTFVHSGSARWHITDAFYPGATNTYDIGTITALVRKIHAVTSGVQTANGAESNVKTISESITLNTGGLTTDSTADLLPANSIILAVTARITTQITTTTDWALGDATTAARFAAPNATLTAGTTSVGLAHQQGSVATDAAGPVQIAAAKLRITCSGANPGAGAVRVTVTYLELTPPTS